MRGMTTHPSTFNAQPFTSEGSQGEDAHGLGGQPDVEAAVQAIIGNAYRTLGHYDRAERQLLAALETRLHHVPPPPVRKPARRAVPRLEPRSRPPAPAYGDVATREVYGDALVEGPRFRLSRTPGAVVGPAPSFGDGTQWVLETLLGYDDLREEAERASQK